MGCDVTKGIEINVILILCYFSRMIKPTGASEYLWNLSDEKISAHQRKEN